MNTVTFAVKETIKHCVQHHTKKNTYLLKFH